MPDEQGCPGIRYPLDWLPRPFPVLSLPPMCMLLPALATPASQSPVLTSLPGLCLAAPPCWLLCATNCGSRVLLRCVAPSLECLCPTLLLVHPRLSHSIAPPPPPHAMFPLSADWCSPPPPPTRWANHTQRRRVATPTREQAFWGFGCNSPSLYFLELANVLQLRGPRYGVFGGGGASSAWLICTGAHGCPWTVGLQSIPTQTYKCGSIGL